MKIDNVQRLIWGELEPRTKRRFSTLLPWLPEAVVIFDTDKIDRLGRKWCDEIEDQSRGRTFPFGLKDDSDILYEINRASPRMDQWCGCIAFENDKDSIRFFLSIA